MWKQKSFPGRKVRTESNANHISYRNSRSKENWHCLSRKQLGPCSGGDSYKNGYRRRRERNTSKTKKCCSKAGAAHTNVGGKGFEGTVVWVESVLPGGEVGTLDRRNRDPRLGWTWPGTRSIWPPTWRQVGKHQGQQGPDWGANLRQNVSSDTEVHQQHTSGFESWLYQWELRKASKVVVIPSPPVGRCERTRNLYSLITCLSAERSLWSPGQVFQLVSVVPIHCGCGSKWGHVQEATNEYTNKWNNTSIFVSPSPYSSSSVSLFKKKINEFF